MPELFPAARGLFLRSPRFVPPDPGLSVLATMEGDPVALAGERRLAATSHPELGDDLRWHRGEAERDRPWMREAHAVQRDAIFSDFFERLARAP